MLEASSSGELRTSEASSEFSADQANDNSFPTEATARQQLAQLLREMSIMELSNMLSLSANMDRISDRLTGFDSYLADQLMEELALLLESTLSFHDGLPVNEKAKEAANDLREARSRMSPKLPSQARMLYKTVKGRKASQFFKEQWGRYADAGVLYQHHLSRLDPKLMKALRNEFLGRPDELRALIPTKSMETDRLVQLAGISAPAPHTRGNVSSALRKAGMAPKPA